MPDAADSLITVADYFGVTSNNQQHFFLEERNFCTLVRDVYTVSNPICRVIWFPHSFEVEVRIEILLRI